MLVGNCWEHHLSKCWQSGTTSKMEWIKAVSSEWGDQSKKISLELRPTGGQRVGGLTQSQVVVKICHGTVRKCEWMGHYRQYGIFAFISFVLHQKNRDLVGCRQSLTDRRSIDEKAFEGLPKDVWNDVVHTKEKKWFAWRDNQTTRGRWQIGGEQTQRTENYNLIILSLFVIFWVTRTPLGCFADFVR